MGKVRHLPAVMGPFWLLLLGVLDTTLACPSGCRCDDNLNFVSCDMPSITSLPTGIPANTTSLTISFTKITHLPENAFSKLANLETIHIKYNRNLKSLPAGLFRNLNKLKTVSVSGNNLTALPTGLFKNLPNLEKVVMRNNGLRTLPKRTFINLTKLDVVDFSRAKFVSLPDELFHDVPRLAAVYLDDNRLRSLPENFFSPVSKTLESLLLYKNQFNKMPVKALTVLEKLTEIKVSGNPLHCNCSLKAFADWATKLGKTVVNDDIECSDGRKMPLAKFNFSHCAPEEEAVTSEPTTPTSKPTTPTSKPATLQSTSLNSSSALPPSKSTLVTSPSTPSTQSSGAPPSESPRSKNETSNTGGIDTRDTSNTNEKRKVVIVAVSVSVIALVVLLALIFWLFHTGILSSRCGMNFKKDKMVVYDAEGHILVKDGKIVTESP